MAKIKLRSGDTLQVEDEEARRVSAVKQETQLTELSLPTSIQHTEGVWVGSLSDVQQIFLGNIKDNRIPFESKKDLCMFHVKYGKHKEYYKKGFGLLDMSTLYRIDNGMVELIDDGFGLVLVDRKVDPSTIEELMGKWAMYTSNLALDGTLLDNVTLDGREYFSKHELRASVDKPVN